MSDRKTAREMEPTHREYDRLTVGFSTRVRRGTNAAEISSLHALPPVKVPECLNVRQYLAIVQESQGD